MAGELKVESGARLRPICDALTGAPVVFRVGSFTLDFGGRVWCDDAGFVWVKCDEAPEGAYTDKNGDTYNWPLVFDTSTYPESLKYSAFAAGDNPYTVIENNDNPDGKTCVIVKESFANAMIPFIAGSYKTVHVIDYRYWNGKLTDFVSKNNVDDVIFMNNISATRNSQLVSSLSAVIG